MRYQFRSRSLVRPSFSWISWGFMAAGEQSTAMYSSAPRINYFSANVGQSFFQLDINLGSALSGRPRSAPPCPSLPNTPHSWGPDRLHQHSSTSDEMVFSVPRQSNIMDYSHLQPDNCRPGEGNECSAVVPSHLVRIRKPEGNARWRGEGGAGGAGDTQRNASFRALS